MSSLGECGAGGLHEGPMTRFLAVASRMCACTNRSAYLSEHHTSDAGNRSDGFGSVPDCSVMRANSGILVLFGSIEFRLVPRYRCHYCCHRLLDVSVWITSALLRHDPETTCDTGHDKCVWIVSCAADSFATHTLRSRSDCSRSYTGAHAVTSCGSIQKRRSVANWHRERDALEEIMHRYGRRHGAEFLAKKVREVYTGSRTQFVATVFIPRDPLGLLASAK